MPSWTELTWREVSDGDLALGHPFGESTRRANVVGRRDVELGAEEERSEDWIKGSKQKEKRSNSHIQRGQKQPIRVDRGVE